ncbi:hypothetical protein CAPTEDRAFT_217832 [Capitella teleta]|uniref:Tetraspanin n=1 Tax=Capitella teleta TaxID=283909 RepID=R7VGL9_CAPTE|nr:hypothetical protein CAPTEDRAFT_217832 [Capitella teleta]|eukprot:ELU17692.1 hypothetical protein CAPTEDRAFT_217832 [Capitella teleta]
MATCHKACAKVFVIVLDVILLGLGIGLLGVGIWFRVDQRAKDLRTAMDTFLGDDLSDTTSWLVIAVGVAITCVAVVGLVGALLEVKLLLSLFCVLLIAMIACEVAACALAAIYKENLFEDLIINMEESRLKPYYNQTTDGALISNDEVGRPWDFLQSTFECCDVYSYQQSLIKFNTDYNIPFPYSCCRLNSGYDKFAVTANDPADLAQCIQAKDDYFNSEGCFLGIVSLAEDNIVIILGVAIAVACFTLFLFIFAVCLCVNIDKTELKKKMDTKRPISKGPKSTAIQALSGVDLTKVSVLGTGTEI